MNYVKALPTLALVIFATLAISLAAFAAGDAGSNICDAQELWEEKCHSAEDWAAGWYLHPDNDPGDGSAVETAYTNFAAVIVHMPHSMCIDWRTANCDGTIPPDPPVTRSKELMRVLALADTPHECFEQANTKASIDPYCRVLLAYDLSLSDGDAGYSASLEAAATLFKNGLLTQAACVDAANNIDSRGADYTAGTLDAALIPQTEADIVAVQSWTCVTHHNLTPPTIPDPPSS